MKKSYLLIALTLLFSSASYSQTIADYNILIIQGYTSTHEDVMIELDGLGHVTTAIPHTSIIEGFDFSPYDVAIFMWDTPMTFTGFSDLIEANEACEIGIISMSHSLGMDSLHLGQGDSWTAETFGIINNSHWITEPWSVGALPLDFTYKAKLSAIPDGVTALGVTGSDTSLVVHDTYKRASGVYYGHTSGMPWNADAANLFDRIICWTASSCCAINTTVNTVDFVLTAEEEDATYQWIDCSDNSEIDGATNQSFTATENGEYAVVITTPECSDTSDCTTIAGLSIENLEIEVAIYPNPSNGNFSIRTNQQELANISIFDASGKQVYSSKIQGELLVNLPLESGTYFVQYISDQLISTSRIIIE